MTKEQIEKLRSHVAWHKPRFNTEDGTTYSLIDGEIVEFSSPNYTNNNVQLTINNDTHRKFWFSQLSQPFIRCDLELEVARLLNSNQSFFEMSDNEFWAEVRGKRYKVHDKGIYYVIKNNSDTEKQHFFPTMLSIYEFVKDCVQKDRIEEIGDLLKTAHLYDLEEIA